MAKEKEKKKKKKGEPKVVLERTYNVPLRRGFISCPHYRRAKKAVGVLRKFLKRHMKANSLKDIKIGKYANLEIWKKGIKNPPHHIKVNVKKDDEGMVFAELVGAPEEKIEIKEELKEEIKKPEVKGEEKKEEKKEKLEEIKEEAKEKKKSTKELQKEVREALERKKMERRPEETEEKKEKDKVLTKKI